PSGVRARYRARLTLYARRSQSTGSRNLRTWRSGIMITRRAFLKYTGGTALTLFAFNKFGIPRAIAHIPGGTLDPGAVSKYQTPLLIPPVMPRAGTITLPGGQRADYYEISMKQ